MGFFFAAQYTDSLRSKKSTSHDALRIALVDFMHTIVSSTPVIFTFSFIVCRLPLPFLLLPPTLHYDSKTVLHAAYCASGYPDF